MATDENHSVIVKVPGSVLLALVVGFFLTSCSSRHQAPKSLTDIPYRPVAYNLEQPARFVKMVLPDDNPLSEAGVALGRQLFFDPILSLDSSVSCASCHQPARAFTDGLAFSKGVDGRHGLRNAPSLLNVGYQSHGLFWDGRVDQLEALIAHPLLDTNEMASSWDLLLPRLQQHRDYPAQFRRAFGITQAEAIDDTLTANALAQYLRTLISADTRYDRYKAGLLELTASEDRGRRIFFDIGDGGLPASECGHCHVEPLFTGLEYFNNGLDEQAKPGQVPRDAGRGGLSGRMGDIGVFRTPSLRNIALTAPYMHDGRFKTLEEVIDHYDQGGKYGENVHPNVHKLGLSEQHKADLIAFLHTLTEIDPDFDGPTKK